MKTKITITDAQRARLDSAVLAAIKANANTSAKILRDSDVLRELATLPAGKSDMRYVDGSLQRLRRDGDAKFASPGGWRVK